MVVIESNHIKRFIELFQNKTRDIEFNTFWLGATGNNKEKIKEIIRKVGKKIEETGKKATPVNPDLIGIFDEYNLKITIRPLYIYGRYIKLSRYMPQTMFSCKVCNGRGCAICDYTGKAYKTSIEEIIGEPMKRETRADSYTLIGLGREDVDVRMLGNGRPFLIKLTKPKIRNIDLNKIKEEINENERVMVSDLLFANNELVEMLKNEKVEKEYIALVECKDEIKELNLKNEYFIEQRTPTRVMHRRPDLIRYRKIRVKRIEFIDKKHIMLDIIAQHGTYIKEFVSGDFGRTKPSISSIIGSDCTVTELDCIMIFDKLPFSNKVIYPFN